MLRTSIATFSALTTLSLGLAVSDDGKENTTTRRPKDVARQSAEGPVQGESDKTIENSIGIKLVLLPAGSFVMGSDSGFEDEKPVHKVTLTKSLYMGVTEVTQEQYESLIGDNPSQQTGPPNLPVDSVNWDKANEFCKKLSEREGLKYRLPTEAEWEYACRAGGTGRWGRGDDGSEITDETIYEYSWLRLNSESTAPVATKKPNAWGLYDMWGNVFEWCQDRWLPYNKSPVTDPLATSNSKAKPRVDWPEGEWYVLRGGSWEWGLDNSNAAARCRCKKVLRSRTVGFRVVREL